MQLMRLIGADLTDTAFELDVPGFPHIIWNVSKIERDAFRGAFGPPEEIAFSTLAEHLRPEDRWENLDRAKVQRFVEQRDLMVERPYWRTCGTTNRVYRFLDIPTLGVCFKADDKYIGLPVDGNHRMEARTQLGLPSFTRFTVPPELEANYRVVILEQ